MSQPNTTADVSIESAYGAEGLERALSVRTAVFNDEQGFPRETEVDEYDSISTHLIAYQNGEAIGTLRVIPDGKRLGSAAWLCLRICVARALGRL